MEIAPLQVIDDGAAEFRLVFSFDFGFLSLQDDYWSISSWIRQNEESVILTRIQNLPHLKELFLLDPTVAFFNHGSFGACPRPIFDRYQTFQRELEQQPVEFLIRRYPDLMHAAREALAGFVGARPQDLVYIPNATTGVNTIARSLELGAGQEILTTDLEYGALDRMWTSLADRSGAVYRRVPDEFPCEHAR